MYVGLVMVALVGYCSQLLMRWLEENWCRGAPGANRISLGKVEAAWTLSVVLGGAASILP